MKIFWLIMSLMILATSLSLAEEPYDVSRLSLGVIGGGVPVAGGPTYLFTENFDGSTLCATGYTETCTNTWVVSGSGSGTLDFDNAAAPAPLEGTYSLRIVYTDDARQVHGTFDSTNEVWGYLMVNWDTLPTGPNHFLKLRNSSSANQAYFYFNSDTSKLVGVHGTVASSDGATTILVDTTYHIWFHYKISASPGILELFLSTNSTKPGTAEITITNGDATGGIAQIALCANGSGHLVIDKVRVDDIDIGSNPS